MQGIAGMVAPKREAQRFSMDAKLQFYNVTYHASGNLEGAFILSKVTSKDNINMATGLFKQP